jgi:hypothetical protein
LGRQGANASDRYEFCDVGDEKDGDRTDRLYSIHDKQRQAGAPPVRKLAGGDRGQQTDTTGDAETDPKGADSKACLYR